jgi:hypothetical protein
LKKLKENSQIVKIKNGIIVPTSLKKLNYKKDLQQLKKKKKLQTFRKEFFEDVVELKYIDEVDNYTIYLRFYDKIFAIQYSNKPNSFSNKIFASNRINRSYIDCLILSKEDVKISIPLKIKNKEKAIREIIELSKRSSKLRVLSKNLK